MLCYVLILVHFHIFLLCSSLTLLLLPPFSLFNAAISCSCLFLPFRLVKGGNDHFLSKRHAGTLPFTTLLPSLFPFEIHPIEHPLFYSATTATILRYSKTMSEMEKTHTHTKKTHSCYQSRADLPSAHAPLHSSPPSGLKHQWQPRQLWR